MQPNVVVDAGHSERPQSSASWPVRSTQRLERTSCRAAAAASAIAAPTSAIVLVVVIVCASVSGKMRAPLAAKATCSPFCHGCF